MSVGSVLAFLMKMRPVRLRSEFIKSAGLLSMIHSVVPSTQIFQVRRFLLVFRISCGSNKGFFEFNKQQEQQEALWRSSARPDCCGPPPSHGSLCTSSPDAVCCEPRKPTASRPRKRSQARRDLPAHRVGGTHAQPAVGERSPGARRRVGTCRHSERSIFSKAAPGLCHVPPWLHRLDLRQLLMAKNKLPVYIQQRHLSLACRFRGMRPDPAPEDTNKILAQ